MDGLVMIAFLFLINAETLYSLQGMSCCCEGEQYDPTSTICCRGTRRDFPTPAGHYQCCGEKLMNADVEECAPGFILYSKCVTADGPRSYNYFTQFCMFGQVWDKCGGREYNPYKQFCYHGRIHNKCGDRPYDLRTDFCYGGDIYKRCGRDHYEPSANFLLGVAYDVEQEFCDHGRVLKLCAGQKYDPKSEFCNLHGDIVVKK